MMTTVAGSYSGPIEAGNEDAACSPAWAAACESFLQSKDFSDEERKLLMGGSAESVRADLINLDAQHAKASRFRRFTAAIHLRSFLDGVANLDEALSSMAAADPHLVAPLVWGVIRLLCNTVRGALKHFSEMVEFLNRVGSSLSRLQFYEKLVSNSPRLNSILFRVFILYLQFCSYLRDGFIKDGGAHRLTAATTWRFGTDSFKSTSADKIAEIDNLCKDAHLEGELAVADAQLKATSHLHQAVDKLTLQAKKVHDEDGEFQRKRQLIESKQNFLAWLRQVPTEEDFEKCRKTQLESTCEWIEDDPNISSWLYATNNHCPLLWISAPPGTGKTILATHIINQLQGSHPTAYFYCKIDDERKRSTIAILSNWIWQLVHRSKFLPPEVTSPSDLHQSPTVPVLRGILERLQQFLKPSWLVVDGLDEVDGDLTEFLECCLSLSSTWHILIVSRDVLGISTHLRSPRVRHKAMTAHDNGTDIQDYVHHKRISIEDTKQDLDKFISTRAGELAERKGWKAVEHTIDEMLSSNAEGMFLWVTLVLDFLMDGATMLDDVDDILKDIPSGLDKFYDRIMVKISSHPSRKRIAQRSLEWILYSFRPLTIYELHAAISAESNSSKPISEFELVLNESCGALIKIDNKTKQVGLMHATVQEYLLRCRESDPMVLNTPEAVHTQITTVCLSYLCSMCRSSVHVPEYYSKAIEEFRSRFRAYPLLDYAVGHWLHHALSSDFDNEGLRESLRQFSSSDEVLVNWLQLFRFNYGCLETIESDRIIHQALWPEELADKTTLKRAFSLAENVKIVRHLGLADGKRFLRWDRLFHSIENQCLPAPLIAAHFDFSNYLKKEISRRKWKVDQSAWGTGSAIHWAARTDSVETANYLLKQGAAVNLSTESNETALTRAICAEKNLRTKPGGYYPTALLLLEAGADLRVKDDLDRNALHVLLDSQNEDGEGEVFLAKEIIKRNPGLCFDTGPIARSIFHLAVLMNRPHLLRAIHKEALCHYPEREAQVLEARSGPGTPLHLALRERPELVPLLLDLGADMKTRDVQNLLPVEIAVRNDQWMILKEFISRGFDMAIDGTLAAGLMRVAFEVQSENTIRTLLDMGVAADKIPDDPLLLPRGFDLDRRIINSRPTDFPWPLSPRDVYQICFHLQQCYALPIPVISQILDFAEVWLQSSVVRRGVQIVTQDTPVLPYLISAPVQDRMNSSVKKLSVSVMSHDQGFDDNNGTSGSWTWFEVVRIPGNQINREKRHLHTVKNVPGDYRWQHHQASWDSQDHSGNLTVAQTTIDPSDRIEVIPRARYPGWANYVRETRIDIFTSLIRRFYTPEEILDIWGMATPWGKPYSDYMTRIPRWRSRSGITTQRSSGLHILAAEYGGNDVTNHLAKLINAEEGSLTMKGNLGQYLPDTWYLAVKSLSLMFRFGMSKPQLLITKEYDGGIKIESSSPLAESKILGRTTNWTNLSILAIVYGAEEIVDETVHQRVLAAVINEEPYLISNTSLGGDPWRNTPKSCAVYYRREKEGPVLLACGKEGEHLYFNA